MSCWWLTQPGSNGHFIQTRVHDTSTKAGEPEKEAEPLSKIKHPFWLDLVLCGLELMAPPILAPKPKRLRPFKSSGRCLSPSRSRDATLVPLKKASTHLHWLVESPDQPEGGSRIRRLHRRRSVAMSFTGTQDKCKTCDKTVHFIDLLSADGISYHKTCFKCSHCKGTLSMCNYSSMDGVLYCKTHFEQLFKETGSFSKKFTPGGKSSDKNDQAKAPNKLSSVFSGTQDKCAACQKTVYPLEKVEERCHVLLRK
ncbi:hypothetical protein BRADI_3g49950v3 [Brachypodium distachyon]|uniref:LIM zinc-binding domain-containing protein n=1 Tax=Brachypodium distachyon TaxID=15368 RepID=A0A2K2D4D1_BRADI|nr:hypothetical protein BRADI_3g49950v3 [Brachypodium distachyon]